MEEDDLGDAPPDDERDRVPSRIVRDLHRPAVYIPHIAPAGALADLDEVASHRGACLDFTCDEVASADELFGVSKDGLSRLDHDNAIGSLDASPPVKRKGDVARTGSLHWLSPDGVHVVLVPRIVNSLEGTFLFSEKPPSESDIVA